MRLLRHLIDITIASLSVLRSCSITIAALVGCAIAQHRYWNSVLGREVKEYGFCQVSPLVISELVRDTPAWRRQQQQQQTGTDTSFETNIPVLTEKIIVEGVRFSETDKERLSKQIEAQGKPKPRQASAVYQKRPERKKRSEPSAKALEEVVDAVESQNAEQTKRPESSVQRECKESFELPPPEAVVDFVESYSADQKQKPEPQAQQIPPTEEAAHEVESESAEEAKGPAPPLHRHRSTTLHLLSLLPQQQPPASATPRLVLPGLSSQSSPERRARKKSLKHALSTAINRAAMRQSQDSLLSGTTAQASNASDGLISGGTVSPRSPVKFDWTPVRRRASSVQERGGPESFDSASSKHERSGLKPFIFNVQAVEFKPAVHQETSRLPEWRRRAQPLPSLAGTPPALYCSPDLALRSMQNHTPPSQPRMLQSPRRDPGNNQTFVPDLTTHATQSLPELREHHTALLASLHHYAPAYLALGQLYHSSPLAARTSPWILPAFQQIVGEAFIASRDRQLPELVQIFGEISMRLTQASKLLMQKGEEVLLGLERELRRGDELLGEAAVRLRMLQSAVGEICGVYENDRERYWVEDEEGVRERGVTERAWVGVLPEVCMVLEPSGAEGNGS
ncbi:hypothetical protein B0A48_15830 [Cryoendolithus antarcticus]|uniref:Uncharacterized protein n=1 Tax=Cryoendolithus antarcticus TaxID=1507870 RepID=A0A1V8SHF3_9PEZI|nr:hypothetical protein B0A48_15830 [Cryoendolithus antarcticus]